MSTNQPAEIKKNDNFNEFDAELVPKQENDENSVESLVTQTISEDLLDFVTESVQNITTPLNILNLCDEFKAQTGATHSISALSRRITQFLKNIDEVKTIDSGTKVKMLFGLRASIQEEFLEELRKTALVRVDDQNRITKYKANDGTLELGGDRDQVVVANLDDSVDVDLVMNTGKSRTPNKRHSDIPQASKKHSVALVDPKEDYDSDDEMLQQMAEISLRKERWKRELEEDSDEEIQVDEVPEANQKQEVIEAPTKSDLLNFVAQKVENITYPLNVAELCQQFINHTGEPVSVQSQRTRLLRYREDIPEMNNFSQEVKVKMLFGLSAPVKKYFLNELRKTAHVKVDKQQRITKYKANDGSLDLEGNHCQFAKMRRVKSQRKSLRQDEYEEEAVDSETTQSVQPGSPIPQCTSNNDALQLLAQLALLNEGDKREMDDLEKTLMIPAQRPSIEDNQQDANALFEFIAQKVQKIITPLNIDKLCRDFKEQTGAPQSCVDLEQRVRKLRETIAEKNMNMVTKVKMLFGLGASIGREFLIELRKTALVEVDDQRRITKYITYDRSIHLVGVHSHSVRNTMDWERSSKRRSDIPNHQSKSSIPPSRRCSAPPLYPKQESDSGEEDQEEVNYKQEMASLSNFVAQKVQNVTAPLDITQLCGEFKKKTRAPQSCSALHLRIRKFRNTIAERKDMDMQTKVKMIFGLAAAISRDFLIELRKTALVEVDDQQRITKYITYDGSLQLKGDHSRSAKRKKDWERRKSNKRYSDFPNLQNESSIQASRRHSAPLLIPNQDYDSDDEMLQQMAEISHRKVKWKRELEEDSDEEDQIDEDPQKTRTLNVKPESKRRRIRNQLIADLTNFLVQSVQNIISPLNIRLLADQFKVYSGAPQTAHSFQLRIAAMRNQIEGMESLDKETKIKLLFGLSAAVKEGFLKELRKTALVEVDDQRRITKYTSIDGSFELEGDHRISKKISATRQRNNTERRRVVDSDDIDLEMIDLMTPFGVENPDSDRIEPPRKKTKPTNYTGTVDSFTRQLKELVDRAMEQHIDLGEDVGSVVDHRSMEQEDLGMDFDDGRGGEEQDLDLGGVSLSPATATVKSDTVAEQDDNFEMDMEALFQLCSEKASAPPQPIDDDSSISAPDHINILESINTVIHSMNLPTLKELQTRIEENIDGLRAHGDEEENVTFNELRAVIQASIRIIAKSASKPTTEAEETTSLRKFLLIFLTAIAGLKFPIMETCERDLKEMIVKLAVEDKKFPIDKIAFTLQIIVDIIAP